MKEWTKIHQSDTQENWRFKGDLELDLSLMKSIKGLPDKDRPFFEMARFLEDPKILETFSEELRESDREALLKNGSVIDIIFSGANPEEVEEYCKEHFLPLPENYKEAWLQASGK